MKPRRTTWGEIREKGTVVQLKTVAYSVEDERQGWLRLKRLEDGVFMPGVPRPADDAEVTVLEPTHAEAVQIVAERMTAEWLAHQTPGRPWLQPIFPTDDTDSGRAAARRHLWIAHGWTDHSQKKYTIAELGMIHASLHIDPDPKTYRPHTHGDLFVRLEETAGT